MNDRLPSKVLTARLFMYCFRSVQSLYQSISFAFSQRGPTLTLRTTSTSSLASPVPSAAVRSNPPPPDLRRLEYPPPPHTHTRSAAARICPPPPDQRRPECATPPPSRLAMARICTPSPSSEMVRVEVLALCHTHWLRLVVISDVRFNCDIVNCLPDHWTVCQLLLASWTAELW